MSVLKIEANTMILLRFALVMALFTVISVVNPSTAYAEKEDRLVSDFEHFYDDIDIQKLSKLYWKMQALDLNNDVHVDNFLFINECDIYNDYFYNELEWGRIRNQAKDFILDNIEDFPVRFKFVQPLKLEEYDQSKEVFHVLPFYQLNGLRKFEVLSTDFKDVICSQKQNDSIDGYPRVLLVEFTQPLNIKEIPMRPAIARRYIDKKMQEFDSLPDTKKSKSMVYNLRNAYIVMKMKIFSYKGQKQIENGLQRASVYGMLEGYEIYGDRDLTDLLYFENFVRKAAEKPVDVRLKEQYEALRRKRGQSGLDDEPEDENDLMNLKN